MAVKRASTAKAASGRDKAKITLEELERLIADPATPDSKLARYVVVDEERSTPFGPRLAPNPDTVDIPATPAARARGDVALASLNWLSRLKRRSAFERRMAGGYAGPVVVSEGDSWFQFPVLLKDVIDNLTGDYAILSLDAAGDTLQQMVNQGEYLTGLTETGASVFLFSAGGNDVLGGGNLKAHLRTFDSTLSPADHILPSFNQLLDHAIALYDRILRDVEKLPGGVHTICHGYDWALPNGGKWLGEPMAARGIVDPAFQAAIVRVMIDRFNARLAGLAKHFKRVTFLDVRGVVGAKPSRWHDELHPTNAGYADVAARFRATIAKVGKPRKAPAGRRGVAGARRTLAETDAAPAADIGRKGLSLHVGLNHIDPAHYGADAPLEACVFDAQAMESLARAAGFAPTVLTDAAATREAVIAAIKTAAAACEPGDIFLYSYAGHGSQIPDLNGDEPDRADETFCLYDGMLVDDEIYDLWCTFQEDVRIVVVSDSCHSGSVIRAAPPPVTPGAPARRELPRAIARASYLKNRPFYADVSAAVRHVDEGRLIRELATPLKCSVLLLSGCQDNQTSADGLFNGRFTEELLNVWRAGDFDGGYEAFHTRIVAGMPADQTPNIWFVGRPNPAFLGQKPFTI